MSSTDELISAAILGDIDQATAARQIGVKLAVQRKIFCPECDSILDQQSAELWHNADTGRALTVLCPECSARWKAKVQEMHAAHHRTHGPQGAPIPEYVPVFRVDTWERSFPA
jgi:hypothetical protein